MITRYQIVISNYNVRRVMLRIPPHRCQSERLELMVRLLIIFDDQDWNLADLNLLNGLLYLNGLQGQVGH